MNVERRFLLVLALVVTAASALVVLPYLQYVLLAVLLGYLLSPLQRRLAPRVGRRPAAVALMATTTLVVLVPIGALLAVAARQALSVLTALQNGTLGIGSIESLVRRRAGIAVDVSAALSNVGVSPDRVIGALEQRSGTVFDLLTTVLGGVSAVLIGLTVLLFSLYYFLIDGDALVSWLRGIAPVSADTWTTLVDQVDRLMWAVLVGNLVVALIQGVLTGIGFLVVGINNVVFWTVVTVSLSLLPLIGASVIWIPASGYLLVVGRPVAALSLFVYGALVVSLSDNYVRPMIGGREADLNPALFVLGIFGGLAAFGFMGLFFGPVAIGTAKVVLELASRSERSNARFGG